MTDPILQAYYDAHDRMMVAEQNHGEELTEYSDHNWGMAYGLYKIARYNAVEAGLIPETPQFEDAR